MSAVRCVLRATLALYFLAVMGCANHAAPAVANAPMNVSAPAVEQSRTSRAGGWADVDSPVVGGAGARPEHIYRVRNRNELASALGDSARRASFDAEKIIYVEGEIDLSVDANNRPLHEEDYRDPEFSWDEYAKAFHPATWGKSAPAGPQEDARRRSAQRQGAVVVLHVGSNTSLIGVGPRPLIKNGSLMVKDAHNVIIQNLAFEDAYDYFPLWDPKDNADGEWNSEYDNVTLYNARRVWIDHCTFSDGARPDHMSRWLFNRPMQFHDGLLDIVRGSDRITVSNSHFRNHDKGLLIGNSDNRADDDGKLRVTMHHNWFENVRARSPRVRYGRVHVFNNLYTASPGADYGYDYSIGVGFSSRVIAEANVFDVRGKTAPVIFKRWRGNRIDARGNRFAANIDGADIDASTMLQNQSGGAVTSDVGWTIPYTYSLDDVRIVEQRVRSGAGVKRAPSTP